MKCGASRFRLQGNQDNIVSWGHEYLRNLAGEIGEEYQSRREAESSAEDLLALVKQIAPHHMAHNAEPEAVDLLLEVRALLPYDTLHMTLHMMIASLLGHVDPGNSSISYVEAYLAGSIAFCHASI